MKKLLFLMLSGFMILSACGDEETPAENETEEEQKEVAFTDEDIELAKEMVMFANELEIEYADAANEKYEDLYEEDPDLYTAEMTLVESEEEERAEAMKENFYPMAEEMIAEPFFEEYGDYLYVNENNDSTLPGFNYTQWEQLDERENPSATGEYEFYPMYENLVISKDNVKPIPELDIHELEISIDEENTILYKDYDDAPHYKSYGEPSDKITFYKTEEDEFVIGTFPILGEYQNEINYDSDRQIENAKELLNSLPELK